MFEIKRYQSINQIKIKLLVWIQPAADYMTVNLRSMKAQSQGAVFPPMLLFRLHWTLPCQNITAEQTLTGVKNCNNKNNSGGRLPANRGFLQSICAKIILFFLLHFPKKKTPLGAAQQRQATFHLIYSCLRFAFIRNEALQVTQNPSTSRHSYLISASFWMAMSSSSGCWISCSTALSRSGFTAMLFLLFKKSNEASASCRERTQSRRTEEWMHVKQWGGSSMSQINEKWWGRSL